MAGVVVALPDLEELLIALVETERLRRDRVAGEARGAITVSGETGQGR